MARCPKLRNVPVFNPIVTPCFAGMEVIIGLHASQLNGGLEDLANAYRAAYPAGGLIRFAEHPDEEGFLSSAEQAWKDDMEITVYGNAERMNVIARFDNLGKGASGAAIQNMNLALGLDERTGLVF